MWVRSVLSGILEPLQASERASAALQPIPALIPLAPERTPFNGNSGAAHLFLNKFPQPLTLLAGEPPPKGTHPASGLIQCVLGGKVQHVVIKYYTRVRQVVQLSCDYFRTLRVNCVSFSQNN